MTKIPEIYSNFLATWILIPESCKYEQGDPPVSSTYLIKKKNGQLIFKIFWTESNGNELDIEFGGIPDGIPVPFNGGGLADELAVKAVSAKELNSIGSKQGRELMIAQRQLDDTGQAMRITQVIYHDDGSQSSNTGVYRRKT